ncbi:hypothetical protein A0J48_007065 [Sphaerospermopsis aphanizomenoides BCCUSP55]|nr:hypothetical protein [Sphaerospermopsis aphanizomenoides]MBK1987296.1 hypothetical protein [Sphaerospermopsis aphanizomenoides BCCUSP55]
MDTISIILLTALLTWVLEKSADAVLFLIIKSLKDKSEETDNQNKN